LTGGDPITARFLFNEFFTFVPTAKFWLVFNHFPSVKDESEGFWRRVRVIPFEHQFSDSERDNKLLEKLKSEAVGILSKGLGLGGGGGKDDVRGVRLCVGHVEL
jgi:putative DNA primase/helicase